MPILIEHDPERLVMRVTLTGAISDADLDGYLAEVRARGPSFLESHQLVDLSAADLSGVSGEMVRRAASAAPLAVGARRAIVAPDDLAFGMSRMYAAAKDGRDDTRLFRDRGSALEWLGVGGERG
jgi:hypothetical protein